MNTDYYKDLDTNFEQAFELSSKDFSHKELIQMLKNGNLPEKQIAALYFDEIENIEDAEVLLSNLTGCDGKIREAVALKINQMLLKTPSNKNFFEKKSALIFANATIDINANICRLVVDSVKLLKSNTEFSQIYINEIMKFTSEAFKELDNFIFRDKKYVINKQLFKLYWCLETIKNFIEFIDKKELEIVLNKASEQSEYTIREKVAQIIVQTNKFESLKNKLSNDENYYVREALKH